MQLCGIPCRTTNGLASYSKLVTSTIALFNNTHSSTGSIAEDTSYGLPPNEDRLDYWDKWNTDITFGRYLLFTKPNEVIPFWTGFSSTKDKTIYCVWFEKKNPFMQYIGKLKSLKKFIIQESCKELWIEMDDPKLEDLCKSCTNPSNPTLDDFWHSVLKELQ